MDRRYTDAEVTKMCSVARTEYHNERRIKSINDIQAELAFANSEKIKNDTEEQVK